MPLKALHDYNLNKSENFSKITISCSERDREGLSKVIQHIGFNWTRTITGSLINHMYHAVYANDHKFIFPHKAKPGRSPERLLFLNICSSTSAGSTNQNNTVRPKPPRLDTL